MNKKLKVALIAVLGVLLVFVGGSTAYAIHYQDRALPKVFVAGEPVTGKTADEIATMVEDRAKSVKVSVTAGDDTQTFSLSELGASVNSKAVADQAMSANQNVMSRFQALVNTREVPISYTIDEEALTKTADALTKKLTTPAKQAEVKFDENAGAFTSTESKPGSQVKVDDLESSVKQAASTLNSTSTTLSVAEVKPELTTEDAKKLADEATAMVNTEVAIVDQDGTTYSPSATDKSTWLNVDTKKGKISVVPEKVTEWVNARVEDANVPVLDTQRSVTPQGKEIRIETHGHKGFAVNNADQIAKDIQDSIAKKEAYRADFAFDVVEPKVIDNVIADLAPGAENLVYTARVGEKWLDLNLSTNSVTAYEGATPVTGAIPIVPGAPGMETPTGTFSVYLKYASQDMRGTNLDGSSYYAPGVQWVTYFTGSIAFHAAPWQPSFGWSGPGGSHGCVNMSTDTAKFIYDWAPLGTVVVSHY